MIAMIGIVTLLGISIGLLTLPLALAGVIFWIWMLIHCIRNDGLDGTQRVLWALLIWFLPIIGSIVYFFVGRTSSKVRTA
jgi:hypothetical protein